MTTEASLKARVADSWPNAGRHDEDPNTAEQLDYPHTPRDGAEMSLAVTRALHIGNDGTHPLVRAYPTPRPMFPQSEAC